MSWGGVGRSGGAGRSGRSAEWQRLAAADAGELDWRAWGPYVSERAWGTVREDYSAHGTAWDYFPHDHARSRAYRWSEDGLAGVCDQRQLFCFALALWNGKDAIIKERIFGLGGPEGNHGEDAKEYWWYLDSTPTHSWMSWRYHYPQSRFPYGDIVRTNAARGREEPEFELVDTGIFDAGRYWAITVDYAKATPADLCIRISVENRGPDPASLHVLPTLWFRNTWAWDQPADSPGDGGNWPLIRGHDPSTLVAAHPDLGTLVLAGQGRPRLLFCDNESNAQRLWGLPNRSPYPKDAINDHLIAGADTLNPEQVGTKAALHYRIRVAPGATRQIRLRLTRWDKGLGGKAPSANLAGGYAKVMAAREREADEYFAELTPDTASPDEAMVLRQGVAGLMWGKQFYHYDVDRWLNGDPAGDPPPPSRGRNHRWRHMRCSDIISMPDPWEYPWYAAWDLAFQAVAIARVDPAFAKEQVLLLLNDRYLHPTGQLPAYEWALDDVNPPVHAWAAVQVFRIDGSRDAAFLARALPGLLMNFTWWINERNPGGTNVFEGGFLGLDNVGPFDRGAGLPEPGVLVQSDATAWMALYALSLFEICLLLAQHQPDQPGYRELAAFFLRHFTTISAAASEQGLWDEEDGFYYDVIRLADGGMMPLKVRSVVGLLPLAAALNVRAPSLANLNTGSVHNAKRLAAEPQHLFSAVGPHQLGRVLARLFDPDEFLSPYGIRSLSRAHLAEPFTLSVPAGDFSVGYEPGPSATGLFGGNSNWRGPVWFPVNHVIIAGLRELASYFGDDPLVEYPTGSGAKHTLAEIADDLTRRLVSLFRIDAQGRRPIHGDYELFQRDPNWRDLILFYEFCHGDTGAGLGASHQTGWTGLVVDLIMRLHE